MQDTFKHKGMRRQLIDELRQEGNVIYTNTKVVDGQKVSFYRLGTPTKALVRAALSSGYSLTA